MIVNNFVDCGENIKLENIKEEINEEESVENPLFVQQNDACNPNDNVNCNYIHNPIDIIVEDSDQNIEQVVNNQRNPLK